jgi:hypothetical protein
LVLEREAEELGALVGVAEGAGLLEELAGDGFVWDEGGEVFAEGGAVAEGFLVEFGQEIAEEAADGAGEGGGGAGHGGRGTGAWLVNKKKLY